MTTYTPEFERFWTANAGNLVNDDNAKRLCWLSWRTGREKLHEELIHLKAQRAA
jgi:hypothetical protein